MQNLLRLKSHAFFLDAFRGTVDVRVISGVACTSLTAKIHEPDRFRPILFAENRLRVMELGEPHYKGAYHGDSDLPIVDGGSYAVSWCGKRVSGVFRKNVKGSWIVQPLADCLPDWWEAEDWITIVVDRNEPHVRDLLIPARR